MKNLGVVAISSFFAGVLGDFEVSIKLCTQILDGSPNNEYEDPDHSHTWIHVDKSHYARKKGKGGEKHSHHPNHHHVHEYAKSNDFFYIGSDQAKGDETKENLYKISVDMEDPNLLEGKIHTETVIGHDFDMETTVINTLFSKTNVLCLEKLEVTRSDGQKFNLIELSANSVVSTEWNAPPGSKMMYYSGDCTRDKSDCPLCATAMYGISCSTVRNYPFNLVNECTEFPHGTEENRCDENAICTDTTFGYTCECKPGYGPTKFNAQVSVYGEPGCQNKEWTDWSTCSSSCDGGTQTRTRWLEEEETQDCNTHACHEWTEWSDCSVTCGSGTQTRTKGPETEERACQAEECAQWSEWSECSVTCGNGHQTRTKENETQQQPCEMPACPEWTEWTDCSATCGDGTQTRTREPNDVEERNCNLRACPVWTPWSECSQSCGSGTRRRDREGEVEEEPCNTHDCPECECPGDKWICDCAGHCPDGHSCQQTDINGDEYTFKCTPNEFGTCAVYGDPHVRTFDNARNDVYGVGLYVLAQHGIHKEEPIVRGFAWQMFMITDRTGQASSMRSIIFAYYDVEKGINMRLELDKLDKDADLSELEKQSINFKVENGEKFKKFTWEIPGKGVEFTMEGTDLYIKLAAAWQNEVEGICGQYDTIEENDYTKYNPTGENEILEYETGGKDQSDAEYASAISWKKIGDDGKHPWLVKGDCKGTKECEKFFNAKWMSDCREAVDHTDFLNQCKVDYCEMKKKAAYMDLFANYIKACADINPTANGVCQWKEKMNLTKCGQRKVWSGCARHCDLEQTCSTAQECPAIPSGFPAFSEACICPPGMVFENDQKKNCVEKPPCENTSCSGDPCLTVAETTQSHKKYKKCAKKAKKDVELSEVTKLLRSFGTRQRREDDDDHDHDHDDHDDHDCPWEACATTQMSPKSYWKCAKRNLKLMRKDGFPQH
jgi:hypothetical protein